MGDDVRSRVNLPHHVDAQRLRAWRDTCGAEAAAAFDLLFAWLPPSDYAAWRAPRVEQDIAAALQTRSETSWRDQVGDALFHTYVLPQRVAQEPIQPWRTTLHDLLWPRVKGKSLREAVLETNRFCREYATFIPTSARDQGPLTTMDRGLGRCEEEMIFFVSAARSVGIPARPCYTPWWIAGDNNHAWVEAWTGAGWHYLGACEPAPDVDEAWFTEPAKRAGLVLSVAYGEGQFPGEEVYARKAGATLINTTAVYTQPGTVAIEWADLPQSSPSEGADSLRAAREAVPVHVHTFNSGTFAELAEFPSGRGILLGPGDYVAAAEVDGKAIASFVTVRSGETTAVRLDPRGDDAARLGWLEQPFWLRIPYPAPASAGRTAEAPVQVDPLVQRTHELAVASRDLDRVRRGTPDPALLSVLAGRMLCPAPSSPPTGGGRAGSASLPEAAGEPAGRLKDLLTHLEDAGVHANEWASFLARTREDTFKVALGLVHEMDDKDFFECDTSAARAAVREALEVRALRASFETPVPDSLWLPFVLSPRIDRQPGDLLLWRNLPLLFADGTVPGSGLGGSGTVSAAPPRRAGGIASAGRLESAEQIHSIFARAFLKAGASRLGHIATPSEVWTSAAAHPSRTETGQPGLLPEFGEAVAGPASARVGLVGLFRRNGIPARVDSGRRWVEAWVGSEWIPCDPLDERSWNRREGAVAEAYASPAHLEFSFLDLGAPMTQVEAWKHFTLARLLQGRFEPLEADLTAAEGRLATDVEPGDWWLIGGQRNHTGSPRIVARRFRAASGQTIRVETDLGIPPSERDPEDLAAKQLSADGRALLGEAPRSTPVLLFVWNRDCEPCRRTADALRSGEKEFERMGCELLSCQVAQPDAAEAEDLLPRARSLRIPLSRLSAALGCPDTKNLPVVAVVDPEGRTVLWTEGLQLAVVDLARQALRPR